MRHRRRTLQQCPVWLIGSGRHWPRRILPMPELLWSCAATRESGSLPVRTSSIPSGSLPLTVRRWCSIIGAPCWTLTSSRWSRWWAPGMPAPTVWRLPERWATRSVPAAAWWYPARQRALTLRRWRVPWKPGAMWRRCWATDWISSIPSPPNPSTNTCATTVFRRLSYA